MSSTLLSRLTSSIRASISCLGIVAVLCATSSTVSAAILITTSTTAPTEDLYKANPATDNPQRLTLYWRGEPRPAPNTPDQIRSVGQSLSTVGAETPFSLSAITFLVYDADPNVLGKTLQLTIYETDVSTTPPDPANIVETHTGALPSVLNQGDYLTIALDSPLTLQPGKHYSFICSFTEPTSDDTNVKALGLASIGSNIGNVDGSIRWLGSDGTYDRSNKNGFVFYAQATAIPEPNVALLAGGALVSLGIYRRVRNSCSL